VIPMSTHLIIIFTRLTYRPTDPKDVLGLFRRIFQGIMQGLSVSFPCATSRFLGA
jgi:hypothetical protein